MTMGDDEDDDENKRNGGDGERSDSPNFLFSVCRERKVPSCAMNGTEDGTKGHHEQMVQVRVSTCHGWDIQRRNVFVGDRERTRSLPR